MNDRELAEIEARALEFPVGAHRAAEVDAMVRDARPDDAWCIHLGIQERTDPKTIVVSCDSPYHATAVNYAGSARADVLRLVAELRRLRAVVREWRTQ